MPTIHEISKKYYKKIDCLDLELIISRATNMPREFVLAHPDFILSVHERRKFQKMAARRLKNEPLAYILKYKEFYGLDFKVNKNTLIPRPETELLVEKTIKKILNTEYQIPNTIIDVGTGSGNIIISLAHSVERITRNAKRINYYATDISDEALKIAKHNAKINKVDKKIKFIKSDLLKYFLNNPTIKQFNNLIMVANLPYLSKKIYSATTNDIKIFEPRSALLSGCDGLDHYTKLLNQIKIMKDNCPILHGSCIMEISPEQKNKLGKLIKNLFPKAKIIFHKDLSQKWRIAEFSI